MRVDYVFAHSSISDHVIEYRIVRTMCQARPIAELTMIVFVFAPQKWRLRSAPVLSLITSFSPPSKYLSSLSSASGHYTIF